MKRKIIAVYSILLAVSLVALWLMILSGEGVPEGRTEMAFHLSSEFFMAFLSFLSGILLLKHRPAGTGLNIAAHSMVIYSVLNAAGYYGERGQKGMMFMFVALLAVSLAIMGFQLLRIRAGVKA
ncbi:MAG: hypothetical protein ACOYXB_06220 [Bacteroidota bacterium]